jgi:hypothetical protein
MNEIKVFQTGRHYSEKGQRIAYVMDDNGTKLYFVDVDRGIDGVIPVTMYHKSISTEFVMMNYDHGNYGWYNIDDHPIREALRDKALHF